MDICDNYAIWLLSSHPRTYIPTIMCMARLKTLSFHAITMRNETAARVWMRGWGDMLKYMDLQNCVYRIISAQQNTQQSPWFINVSCTCQFHTTKRWLGCQWAKCHQFLIYPTIYCSPRSVVIDHCESYVRNLDLAAFLTTRVFILWTFLCNFCCYFILMFHALL